MKGCVYFLKLNNGKIYVGSTNNLKIRLLQHKKGLAKSTKPFLPIKLIAYIIVSNIKKARILEKYFKAGSGKTILKKRILSDEA